MSPIMDGVENMLGTLGPMWEIPMSGGVVIVFSNDMPGLSVFFIFLSGFCIMGSRAPLLNTGYCLLTTLLRFNRPASNFLAIRFVHRLCRFFQREYRVNEFAVR